MINISAFTTGLNVPSARFRIRQLIHELKSHDLIIKEFPALPSSYAPSGLYNRIEWFGTLLVNRLADLRAASAADPDLYIFQKELISTLPSFEFIFGSKSVFDVDDAIWLNKSGLSSKFIARNVKSVVVANKYLSDYFRQYNSNIYIVPTAVDSKKFIPLVKTKNDKKFVIGWSGTSGGYKFFSDQIQKQINSFLKTHTLSVLRISSNIQPQFEHIDNSKIEYIPWNSSNEAEVISGFDVGLMPLDDSTWSRGKSSYKMLLYMSCKVPVVVSPVGMNNDLLKNPEPPGLTTGEDNSCWFDSLKLLYKNEDLRELMGNNGRKIVVDNFDIPIIASQWREIILRNISV
jgi:glycosyltransferase involved in cell wall biosynthesis